MTERLGYLPTYEQKNPESDRAMERLEVVVEVLGYEEDEATAEARDAFEQRVREDGGYNRENPEHRDLLIAYYDAGVSALGEYPEPETVIGLDVSRACTWLRLGNIDAFLRMVDSDDPDELGVAEMLFQSRLDAAAIEVLEITDDVRALQSRT